MPVIKGAASEFTSTVKSSAQVNAEQGGSAITRPRSSSGAPVLSIGAARSTVIASRVAVSSGINPVVFRRTVTSTPERGPPVKTGLVYQLDATDTTSMTFFGTRTYGSTSYQTVSQIRDSSGRSSIVGTVINGNNPAYIPQVSSSFLSATGFNTGGASSNPAIYYRSSGAGGLDEMKWELNLSGKPMTMFVVTIVNGSDRGALFGESGTANSYFTYDTWYDVISNAGANIDRRNKTRSNYSKPVLLTYGNRLNGSTRQLFLRFNGVAQGAPTNASGNNFFGYNAIDMGRNNGETARSLIYEMLVYDSLLTDAQIASIETYLKDKWNLSMDA